VVKSKKWLSTHLAGDRQLTQGLKARLAWPCTPALGRPRSLAARRDAPARGTLAPTAFGV
jgi:hypothetical protein